MSRTLGILLVLALAFGIAVAYAPDGFDVNSGTGTVGVGEFMPPGQGDAPDFVTALGVKTTTHTWTCTRNIGTPPRVEEFVGVTTQGVKSLGDANLNVKGKVTNYTFGGWTTYGTPTYESEFRPYREASGTIRCTLNWTLSNLNTLVEYSNVSFSY